MTINFSEREKARIAENLDLILKETKDRFNNQKEAWNDLDKKVFYLISFVSLFAGFIIVNDLLNTFLDKIPVIFKVSLLTGLIFIFLAGFHLVRIILPTEFKISASINSLYKIFNKNKLDHLKNELILIYEKMNDHNKRRMDERAEIFKMSMYYVLLGLLLIIISKSHSLLIFLGGV